MKATIIENKIDVVAQEVTSILDDSGKNCIFSAVDDGLRKSIFVNAETCAIEKDGFVRMNEDWKAMNNKVYKHQDLFSLKNCKGCSN